ncbi:hypothetical protein [Spirosoma spitsbergense]|uniref:hypothetical protein n=1 Tax=Spirosoma spitsbergense TaxID=431554 RepID=UPI000374698C|nr:hypothetical protein [Spirosoma spitsbergense]
MRKVKQVKYLLFTTAMLFDNCSQDTFVFPIASAQIEGVYEANSYYAKNGVSGAYPIQGQTMTLKLTSIGRDSVKVEIEAKPNGDYSPGSNRTFEKLVIEPVIVAQLFGKKQVNCIGYNVDLPINQNSISENELLRQICGDGSSIYYYFTSPISKEEATVRFIRK